MWMMIGQEDSDGEEDHRNSISPPKSQVWRCKVLVLWSGFPLSFVKEARYSQSSGKSASTP